MLHLPFDPVLAALPFLPAGKGALILILGGLGMLAFSVLLGRFSRGGPYGVGEIGRSLARGRGAPTVPPRRRPAASSTSRRARPARPGLAATTHRRRGGPPALDFVPRRGDDAPSGPAPGHNAAVGGSTTEVVGGSATEWVGGLRAAAASMGLGQGRMLQVNGDRCVFFLAGCRSCRTRDPGTHGCEATRRAIEIAVRQDAPGARAVETACGALTHGACTFEIQRSG